MLLDPDPYPHSQYGSRSRIVKSKRICADPDRDPDPDPQLWLLYVNSCWPNLKKWGNTVVLRNFFLAGYLTLDDTLQQFKESLYECLLRFFTTAVLAHSFLKITTCTPLHSVSHSRYNACIIIWNFWRTFLGQAWLALYKGKGLFDRQQESHP